jgi:ribonucleoside-diphosphate reductase alpha chain
LSILAGCSGGIEPVFNLAFYRHILEGQELFEVNEPFRQVLQQRGLDPERIGREVAEGRPLGEISGLDDDLANLFVTAHRIAPQWHLRMQAVFQENVDGAISKTINLPHEATPDQIGRMYHKAYELGCKGVTVYRDGCRSDQPMSVKGGARLCPQCRRPVGELTGCARCPHCGCMLCS